MRLQEDHGVPLALPVPAGHIASHLCLQQDGRLPLPLVLEVQLAGANLCLKSGKALLDLKGFTRTMRDHFNYKWSALLTNFALQLSEEHKKIWTRNLL